MNRTTLRAAMAAVFAVNSMGVANPASASGKAIELPPDGVQLTPSALPGYAKAQANCVACHSAEYMLYQPATAPRAYWDAMAKRMKAVFKAPIADDDIPPIVDYLARTYGSERPK
jgi:sulfite dehydrogenase (cytochrome) subunit B